MGGWLVADASAASGWTTDSAVAVSCSPLPRMEIQFSLTTTECSDAAVAEATSVDASLVSHASSSNAAAFQNDFVAAGLSGMKSLELLRSSVHRCDPEIALHLPDMNQLIQAQPLPVSCTYDGSKLTIEHNKPAVHNAFSCKHQYDTDKAVWDCTCSSWDTTVTVDPAVAATVTQNVFNVPTSAPDPAALAPEATTPAPTKAPTKAPTEATPAVPDATPAPTKAPTKAPTDEYVDDALPEDGATPDDGAPPPGDVIDNWSDVDDPTAVPMSAGDDSAKKAGMDGAAAKGGAPAGATAGETAAPTVAQTAEPTVENQWWLMPAAATR